MIFLGEGRLKMEGNEPMLRSCWKCNGAHEHLKKVNVLHSCFECGRMWVFDKFLDELQNDTDFDNFFTGLGLSVDDSTTKIDAGYRINVITIQAKEKPK